MLKLAADEKPSAGRGRRTESLFANGALIEAVRFDMLHFASEKRIAMPTQPVTAHLPVELVQKLDQYAELLERSRGWIVKEAVDAWIEREAVRDRLTREALASADAGRLIDHDRAEEWLDSLASDNPKPVPEA